MALNTLKILCFGTFDILHPGHEQYLRDAKSLGDELYVIVALDKTVKDVKGMIPHNNQEKRLAAVKALPYVDHAMLGLPGDKYELVERIAPDIICLGYDQTAFTNGLSAVLASRGLNPKIVRLTLPLQPEKYKSSKMRPPHA